MCSLQRGVGAGSATAHPSSKSPFASAPSSDMATTTGDAVAQETECRCWGGKTRASTIILSSLTPPACPARRTSGNLVARFDRTDSVTGPGCGLALEGVESYAPLSLGSSREGPHTPKWAEFLKRALSLSCASETDARAPEEAEACCREARRSASLRSRSTRALKYLPGSSYAMHSRSRCPA